MMFSQLRRLIAGTQPVAAEPAGPNRQLKLSYGRYPATRLPAPRDRLVGRAPAAADPWGGAAGTREERRTGSLELLAVYSQLVKVLQRRIDLTIKDALDAGADYGQIAAACGVSRQAVRQRWMRRTAGPGWYEVRLPYPRPRSWTGRPYGGEPARAVVVRLAGGPHDGGRDFASPGEILMYEADGPSSDPPGYVPLLAWYVPSQDDANVYVFAGAERDFRRTADMAGQRPGSAGLPKPRVYELAAEFNVDSKVVMDQLKEMGEFVRSASSVVEHPVAQKLREQFYPQAHRKSGSPG